MHMTDLKRKSNLELLRILAMFFIILIHLASAMDLSHFGLEGKFGHVLGGGIVGICNIGVTCFCLISGYFGIKFSLEKLLKMEIMMIVYSLLETLILWKVFPDQMQGAALLEQLVKSFFPFVSRKYWFYSCYVCLFLFSGYIQKFIDMLKEEELKKFIALSLLIFSVFPTIFYFDIMQDAGKGLVQMITVYIIGRYICIYKDVPVKRKVAIPLFLILWVLNTISIIFPIRFGSIVHSLCRDNSITNITMAILLFYIFKNINFSSKNINKLTSYMFAVFALENALVNVTAKIITHRELYINSAILGIILLPGTVFSILALCLGIGAIFDLLFSKIERKAIASAVQVINVLYEKIRNRFKLE